MGLRGIFALSAIARIWTALHSVFAEDERAVYAAAARFYQTGRPAFTGARVVYTDTVLPGMLQDILAGGPLFLSAGWPWLTVVLIALLQTGAAWMLWDVYHRIFPRVEKHALAVTLAFAPWTLLYSGFINTSYLAPFSMLVFWGWARWMLGEPRAAAAAGLGLLCAIQFNLAAVFLFAWVGLTSAILWLGPLRKKVRAGIGPFFTGVAIGVLPLLPYFWERFTQPSAVAPLSRNLLWDWNHVQDLYKVFFRFLTFPTGETTRFLGLHHGFAGALDKMRENPWLGALGAPTLLAAVGMTLLGLRFFLRPALWRGLLSTRWGVREAIAFAPLLMMALFMLSIKEPSAHTLLPLLALSFYPLLSEWPAAWLGGLRSRKQWILPGLTLLGLVFSVAGYCISYRPSLLAVERAARCQLARERSDECKERDARAYAEVDAASRDLVAGVVRGKR